MAARLQFHILLVFSLMSVVWLESVDNPSVITSTPSSVNATTVKVSTDKPAHAGNALLAIQLISLVA